MRWGLKICKNMSCGEVNGCFPRKKCKFCGGEKFDILNMNAKFIKKIDNPYYEESSQVGGYKNYNGCHHIFVRVPLGKGNDCDYNGGYIHYPNVSEEEVDFVNNYITHKVG